VFSETERIKMLQETKNLSESCVGPDGLEGSPRSSGESTSAPGGESSVPTATDHNADGDDSGSLERIMVDAFQNANKGAFIIM